MGSSSRIIAIVSMSNLLMIPLKYLARVLSYGDFNLSELFLSVFLILVWLASALAIWGVE